jgi:prolipoprotein diacylglyceryltransferase
VELFFVRLGNFFNSEIIGKETNSTFGIKFIRDQFSPMPNATQISNPNEAYQAIANNPQFVNLLEQVPARHPAQLYEAFCYVFVFAILFSYTGKQKPDKNLDFYSDFSGIILRIVVEYVKESLVLIINQGIPYYFIFTAKNQ